MARFKSQYAPDGMSGQKKCKKCCQNTPRPCGGGAVASDPLSMLMGEGGPASQTQGRKLIEQQSHMKDMWIQFMNIFDMALSLADEASVARAALNCKRKEDERLECARRIEEAKRQWFKECCERQMKEQTDKEAPEDSAKDNTNLNDKTSEDGKNASSTSARPSLMDAPQAAGEEDVSPQEGGADDGNSPEEPAQE